MIKKIIYFLGNMVKVVFFLTISVGILYAANFVLKLKSIDGCYVAQMFNKQKPDTVDVVFIGSSHIYTDVNPAVLWTEYGIAAYDLAGSNQPLWNSYYYMKEAIEQQDPELIVIDLYRAIETRDVIDEARIAMNTLGMADGKNKTESIYASFEDEETALSYILQFPVYHTRYESLSESDFFVYNGDVNGENYKGFNINCISVTPFESFSDVTGEEERLPLTRKNEEYLKKMIEYAEETDTELLFMVAPYQGIMPSDKMIFNEVEAIAREYGVSYVDFNEYYGRIGLDPATDCAESSHLNYSGSEKFSDYLGNYIMTRYDIPDRRGAEEYESWDENAEYYETIAYNFRLRNTENIEEYLDMLLENDNYTVCISLDGFYEYGGLDISGMMKERGLEISEEGVVVLAQGETVFYADSLDEDGYSFHMDIGSKTLIIDGTPEQEENTVTGETKEYMQKTVLLNDVGCITVPHGMNILVYDNYTNTFLDSFGFSAMDEYKKVRY